MRSLIPTPPTCLVNFSVLFKKKPDDLTPFLKTWPSLFRRRTRLFLCKQAHHAVLPSSIHLSVFQLDEQFSKFSMWRIFQGCVKWQSLLKCRFGIPLVWVEIPKEVPHSECQGSWVLYPHNFIQSSTYSVVLDSVMTSGKFLKVPCDHTLW